MMMTRRLRMTTRLERAEREVAVQTKPRGKQKRAEAELRRLWPARPDWINVVRTEWASLREPPDDFVRLARSGERVFHEVLGGVAPTRLGVVAMIRGFPQEPMGPRVQSTIAEPEPAPAERETEWEPESFDPVDAIEQKIRNLERAGLWDPGP
jgi:hypothetical protein